MPGHLPTDGVTRCRRADARRLIVDAVPGDGGAEGAVGGAPDRPNPTVTAEAELTKIDVSVLDRGDVHAGEYFEHGGLRCRHDDAETFSCSMGDSGFTLSGPDGDMTFEGTFLDPSGNGSSSGSDDSDASGSSDSPGSSNSSGYVTSVSTGSGTVRASSP